ncbi:hypothetical protein AVEN_46930-2 [Araneus ventricosus]|uniref:Uncharacterized protein n=1 Tax=Araneus ventricosus TaxID=182803 RepID=A0A4Y2FMC0_ARAVE|nr:hypothetical protein AVEN_46930-2 [Araneus ventricosus]
MKRKPPMVGCIFFRNVGPTCPCSHASNRRGSWISSSSQMGLPGKKTRGLASTHYLRLSPTSLSRSPPRGIRALSEQRGGTTYPQKLLAGCRRGRISSSSCSMVVKNYL